MATPLLHLETKFDPIKETYFMVKVRPSFQGSQNNWINLWKCCIYSTHIRFESWKGKGYLHFAQEWWSGNVVWMTETRNSYTKIVSRDEAGLWFQLTGPAFRSRVPSPSSGSKSGVGDRSHCYINQSLRWLSLRCATELHSPALLPSRLSSPGEKGEGGFLCIAHWKP